MSARVAEAFGEYLSRIELNPTRVGLAAQRYQALKEQLESTVPGLKLHRIGSFQRHTKVRPIEQPDALDLDVVAYQVTNAYPAPGQGVAAGDHVDRVFKALRQNATYRAMRPEVDSPTIVLEYADATPFKVEIAPGFLDQRGEYPRAGGPNCYLVAGRGGFWVPADYDYDAQWITSRNQAPASRGALVPLIKMAKAESLEAAMLTPWAAAARSECRTASQEAPSRERARNSSATAMTA